MAQSTTCLNRTNQKPYPRPTLPPYTRVVGVDGSIGFGDGAHRQCSALILPPHLSLECGIRSVGADCHVDSTTFTGQTCIHAAACLRYSPCGGIGDTCLAVYPTHSCFIQPTPPPRSQPSFTCIPSIHPTPGRSPVPHVAKSKPHAAKAHPRIATATATQRRPFRHSNGPGLWICHPFSRAATTPRKLPRP